LTTRLHVSTIASSPGRRRGTVISRFLMVAWERVPFTKGARSCLAVLADFDGGQIVAARRSGCGRRGA
jgi:hypothetical protein